MKRLKSMVEPQIILKNIVIAAHPQIPDGTALGGKIASFLASNGFKAQFGSLDDDSVRARIHDGSTDLLIALGGDGTMLRAGHL
ncbi:MAG: hypothetical protein ACXADB_12740, partial [Candidatus Hermodarchaeia archaeon]